MAKKTELKNNTKPAIAVDTVLASRLKLLIREVKRDIKDCERFERSVANKQDYAGSLKLVGMQDAYKKIAQRLKVILNGS
jgi:hypothetical protein